jgi:hypothetical protein
VEVDVELDDALELSSCHCLAVVYPPTPLIPYVPNRGDDFLYPFLGIICSCVTHDGPPALRSAIVGHQCWGTCGAAPGVY